MAIAIIAVISAIVVPAIAGRQQDQAIIDTIVVFQKIETGLGATNVGNSFRNKVTVNAGRISHLGEQILSTDTTSCSGAATTTYGGNAAKWTDVHAPWFYRPTSKVGIPTGIGTIQDRLVRAPTNAVAGRISAIILSARYEDALRFNELVDASDADSVDGGNRSGKIRFSPPVNRIVDTLYYSMAIDNKC